MRLQTTGLTIFDRRCKISTKIGICAESREIEVSLDQMLGHNPFENMVDRDAKKLADSSAAADSSSGSDSSRSQSSSEGGQTRGEKAESLLAEFKTRKVKLIFRTNNKACALIGDRLIKEGEIIDGIKIVSISNNGVVVQHAPEETAAAK